MAVASLVRLQRDADSKARRVRGLSLSSSQYSRVATAGGETTVRTQSCLPLRSLPNALAFNRLAADHRPRLLRYAFRSRDDIGHVPGCGLRTLLWAKCVTRSRT